MGCRGYVDRGKTKSTPSPSFGLELGLEFDNNQNELYFMFIRTEVYLYYLVISMVDVSV